MGRGFPIRKKYQRERVAKRKRNKKEERFMGGKDISTKRNKSKKRRRVVQGMAGKRDGRVSWKNRRKKVYD